MHSNPSEADILQTMEKTGVIIRHSHVVYTSGKHGSEYINKRILCRNTHTTSALCKLLATHFIGSFVETVVAPAVGAIALGQWVAYYYSSVRGETPSIYAEKAAGNGRFFLISDDDLPLIRQRRVLIIEDVLNTGGSVKSLKKAVEAAGGIVVGVGALVNRGGVTAADLDNPQRLFSLVNVQMDAWPASECPLCATAVPINTTVGHGIKFLAEKGFH